MSNNVNSNYLRLAFLYVAARPSSPKLVAYDTCSARPVFLATEGHAVFREVDEMLRRSLVHLGHAVVNVPLQVCGPLHENSCNRSTSNYGPEALTITTSYCTSSGRFERCSPNTIYVQLEPLTYDPGAKTCCSTPARLGAMSGSVVWDYSHSNVATYRSPDCPLGPHTLIEVLPLRYYDGLTILTKQLPRGTARYRNIHDGRNIDILLLGTAETGDRRRSLLSRLQKQSPSLKILLTDTEFDDGRRQVLISRSKMVVNIHRQPFHDTRPHDDPSYSNSPLEAVRLQYLLSLKSFVVSERSWEEDMRPFSGGVVFSTYNGMIDTILDWIARPASERAAVAQNGSVMVRFPTMKDILAGHMERAIRHLTKRPCKYMQ